MPPITFISKGISTYLTPEQIAEKLCIDPATVRNWIRKGKRGEFIKLKAYRDKESVQRSKGEYAPWMVSEEDLKSFLRQIGDLESLEMLQDDQNIGIVEVTPRLSASIKEPSFRWISQVRSH